VTDQSPRCLLLETRDRPSECQGPS
jgi:hypothetical protein